MKTNITLSAALLIAAAASAIQGQATPAAGAPPVPRATPVAPDAPRLPSTPPAAEPLPPVEPPPPAVVEELPTPGIAPSADNIPAPGAGAGALPGKPRPVPAPPRGVPATPSGGNHFGRSVSPGGGYPGAPPVMVAPSGAGSGFGSDIAPPSPQPGFAELVGPGPDNRPRITLHRGQQVFEAPIPVEQAGQPFVSRADQVVREAKFKVYQRHYETALTELMDIEKALLDAPAEKREALAAKAKALREFSDKLENDLRKLTEVPPVSTADMKSGPVHYRTGAMSTAPARTPGPVADPTQPGPGAGLQRR